MTRARTLADLGSASLATDAEATAAADAAAAAVPTGGKNFIYNGAMQVAQRGTSTASITTSGYYTADRWRHDITSLGTWTDSVESDAPSGSGFSKSLKVLCTSADGSPAAGDRMIVQQKLEGQDVQRIKKGTASAEQLTLSFWVKSNVTGTFISMLEDAENARYSSVAYTVNASATWEKKTITFAADTSGSITSDNASRFILWFWLGAGSTYTSGTLQSGWQTTVANVAVGQTNLAAATNNYWQVTGVQLEVGDTATDFEHLPFGVELARCQRYYQNICGGTAVARSTTDARITLQANPELRAAPTIEQTAVVSIDDPGVAGKTQSSVGLTTQITTRYGVRFTLLNFSGLTQGKPYLLDNYTSLFLDAEL